MKQIITLPQVNIFADGVALSPDVLYALGAVRVQQRLSLPTLCELTFYEPPGPLEAVAELLPGTALRVTVSGYKTPLFVGEVTALEHVYGPARGREIRVRGYDLLHRLQKQQPVRLHVQTTARQLAGELVAPLGLKVQASESGTLWQRVIQYAHSDLQLLNEIAEQAGLYFALREQVLHLFTLAGIGEPIALTVGESLLEARIEVNSAPACRSVTASGWNPLRVEAYEGKASTTRLARKEVDEVAPQRVGGSGERELAGRALEDDQHADALAQAELERRMATELTLWGMAEGNPDLRPGTPVEVAGVADSLTGRYILTSVIHTIDQQKGFLSELSTVSPRQYARPSSPVAALGNVTRVDDPKKLGRVRVSLPTYNKLETEWMHVLSAGAGKDRGLIVLPDVGDNVLVLFSHGNPAQGVVLGGLYGMKSPHKNEVKGQKVRRYTLLAPSELHIENDKGSSIQLSPNKVRLHAKTDLVIEAPGHSITIRGNKIDFEQG